MTIKTVLRLLLIIAAVLALSSCAHKYLVDSSFRGNSKTSKFLLQESVQQELAMGKKAQTLFNAYVRICDLDSTANESNCQDTLILENVAPGSLY